MQKNNRLQKIIIVLVCAVFMISIVPRVKTIVELTARKKALEQEKTRLVQLNQDKEQELAELQHPEAIERIAREQLGMIKKGEKVMIYSVPDKER